MCVLQGMIKCANAFVSTANNSWKPEAMQKAKYQTINSFCHVLRLCKSIIQQSPIRDQDKTHFVYLHRFFVARTIFLLFPILVYDENFSQYI